MRKKLLAGLVIGLMMLGVTEMAYANLIDDTYGIGAGSFELGDFVDGGGSTPGAYGHNWMGLSPGDTTITGWTVGGPGDGVDWLTTPRFGADTGNHSVDLQHLFSSSISTVIPTIAGNVYEISFSAAAVTLPLPSSATGTVSAGSLVNQEFETSFSGLWDQSNQQFTSFKYYFTALSDSTTIRFEGSGPTGPGTGCYGPVIDSVSVEAAPVPEPATMLLFGTGLAGLLGTRIRRKKK